MRRLSRRGSALSQVGESSRRCRKAAASCGASGCAVCTTMVTATKATTWKCIYCAELIFSITWGCLVEASAQHARISNSEHGQKRASASYG